MTITRINPNDYLPLSGGTLAGPLHVAMQSGSWIAMRDMSKAAIDVDTQIDASGNTFRPIMLGKFTDGHWWGFGGIYKRLGFYYWLSTRTANGTDGSVEFDPVNGKMYAGGTELSKVGHSHSGILKSVNYNHAAAVYSGSKNFTQTVPSGYTLLVQRPLGAFVSGDANCYVTDRTASQSGSTVTVNLYIRNPNSTTIRPNYTLLYVKSEFA